MRDILRRIVADFNSTFSCVYGECVNDTITILDGTVKLTVKIERILPDIR